jgi:hypothetical protein
MGAQDLYILKWAGLAGALIVGLVLVVFRPYRAFLYSLFIPPAFGLRSLLFGRVEELGSYFNLFDACMLVALFAFMWERKKSLLLPAPALALVAVLLMGFINSLSLGFPYQAFQGLRWALNVPVLFILTANMVQGDAERIKSLLLTLLAAAVIAEVQHFIFVMPSTEGGALQRTVAFTLACSYVWLVAGPYVTDGRITKPLVQLSIGSLFLMGNIFHQTRSIALGVLGALVLYYGWFVRGVNVFQGKRLRFSLYPVTGGLLLAGVIVGHGVITSYSDRITGTMDSTDRTAQSIDSRVLAYQVEMKDWLAGNIIIGRGLNYYRKVHGQYSLPSQSGIAYGHLGYIAYLSQLGLIGFIVYGFYFPLAVLRRARRLIKLPGLSPPATHLVLLTGACFLVQSLIYLFSGSFLLITFIPGILAGAAWSIALKQPEVQPGT